MGAQHEGITDLGRLAAQYVTARRRRGELALSTWRGHEYALAKLVSTFGARPVRNLSAGDIDRWLQSIGHLAPATRRNHWSVVKGFCDWLVAYRHVAKSPLRDFKPPGVPRVVPRALPHDAVATVLEAAPDQRARLIIVLMVQQGLRRAEVAGLQVGDVDVTGREMRVLRGAKGGHERFVWITDETVVELKGYLNQYPTREGPLIRSYVHPHEGITPTMVGRIVSSVMYEAGIKSRARDGVSAHALRHTAATDMLRHGAHVRDVQAVLGHANLAATERYLPRLVANLEQAMEGRAYG